MAALALLVLAVAGVLGWRGWLAWQAHQSRELGQLQQAEQRVAALEARLDALRRDQRAQTQRIQDAAATNRILRDEVLGLSQRGALLEDSVAQLADSARAGPQSLRLDEAELLLGIGAQRLEVAGDVEGARRAYALAADALQAVDDPRLLNLRQALGQERAALQALGDGPQAAIGARLRILADALPALQRAAPARAAPRPVWQRALAPLVEVQPTRGSVAVAPNQRAAAESALQIELTLARAALERGDRADFRAALGRIDAWLLRLWPDTPALRARRAELAALRGAPLRARAPELGSTLEQLRAIREARPGPWREPAPPASPESRGLGSTAGTRP